MKPALVVLAAGMGSRYGGLKQLDALGPSGETIMDYSVFDAIRAGFGKVVFIIRKDFEDDFRRLVLKKYEGHVQTEVVFQSINYLPECFNCPEDRTKPWGTNHAVLMAKDVINEPFCDTLSENGKVSRGVCEVNAQRHLTTVVERTEILRRENGVCYKDGEEWVRIEDNTPVSMNVWGFTPDYMKYSEDFFKGWLKANINVPKSEYFIPLMVNELINNGTATVEVLDTTAKWFGVTYAEDRQGVVDKIAELVKEGVYPAKLFA